MAARVVVLWDKLVYSRTVLVVGISPLTSSKWVMAVVSTAWALGVGGVSVLFGQRIPVFSKGKTSSFLLIHC